MFGALAGALLPFFQESGGDLTKVTGVDLSDGMLRFARERPSATNAFSFNEKVSAEIFKYMYMYVHVTCLEI